MKVSVIGASGRVGKATAFSLAEENAVNDLVLISRKESIDKVEGDYHLPECGKNAMYFHYPLLLVPRNKANNRKLKDLTFESRSI